MITLSNGHAFTFMTASGAMAYDGLGWPWEWPLRWAGLIKPQLFTHVTKTLSRQPRTGNLRWLHPWSVVKKIPDGVLNSIGLTNPGVEWWCEKIAPSLHHNLNLVVSLEAESESELSEMITMVSRFSIKAIELNLSCPNTGAHERQTTERLIRLCQTARKISTHPLIAKLSVVHDYVNVAESLEDIVEALAINSVPWKLAYPEKPSPLAQFGGGGVSGKAAQPFTWKMAKELSRATSLPVIGPSAWEEGDIEKILELGAKAVSFGSIFVHHPWRPTKMVKRALSLATARPSAKV